MDVLVSVIIPVYNMEKYIEQCINSVLSQTYGNIEIILVNDGSKDNSLSICEEFAQKNRNIKLIDQKNQGVSCARNVGMEQAAGEFIAFLDADDTLTVNAIETLVNAAVSNNADLTIGKACGETNVPISVYQGEEYLKKVLEDNPVAYSVWGILYRSDFTRNISFPKGYAAHEDSYFLFLCAVKKPKVVTLNEEVYCYNNNNADSASRSPITIKKCDDIYNLLISKESIIKKDFSHLVTLFYHLKIKTYMCLLQNLERAVGKEFRAKEKEFLRMFHLEKAYFCADLPCANVSYYKVLCNHLYYLHKVIVKHRSVLKKVLTKFK